MGVTGTVVTVRIDAAGDAGGMAIIFVSSVRGDPGTSETLVRGVAWSPR